MINSQNSMTADQLAEGVEAAKEGRTNWKANRLMMYEQQARVDIQFKAKAMESMIANQKAIESNQVAEVELLGLAKVIGKVCLFFTEKEGFVLDPSLQGVFANKVISKDGVSFSVLFG